MVETGIRRAKARRYGELKDDRDGHLLATGVPDDGRMPMPNIDVLANSIATGSADQYAVPVLRAIHGRRDGSIRQCDDPNGLGRQPHLPNRRRYRDELMRQHPERMDGRKFYSNC